MLSFSDIPGPVDICEPQGHAPARHRQRCNRKAPSLRPPSSPRMASAAPEGPLRAAPRWPRRRLRRWSRPGRSWWHPPGGPFEKSLRNNHVVGERPLGVFDRTQDLGLGRHVGYSPRARLGQSLIDDRAFTQVPEHHSGRRGPRRGGTGTPSPGGGRLTARRRPPCTGRRPRGLPINPEPPVTTTR